MKLYSGPMSMFGAKAQIAALEKGAGLRAHDGPLRACAPAITPSTRKSCASTRRGRSRCSWTAMWRSSIPRRSSSIWKIVFRNRRCGPGTPAARAARASLNISSDEVFFPHIIALMGGRAASTMTGPVAARAAAGALLSPDGATARRSRLSRRRLWFRRHRLLHGAIVWRVPERADDRRYPCAASVEVPNDSPSRRSKGCSSDGGVHRRQGPTASRFPGTADRIHRASP